MKEIKLTQGKVALVDDDDFKRLNQWRWSVWQRRGCGTEYAIRNGKGSHRPTIYMHREVLRAVPGQRIDHRDRNGLNNCRANLRFCTRSQNRWNSRLPRNNTSGYLGVHSQRGRHIASIRVDGIGIQLGHFASPIEAAFAYDEAARKYHGEFATTNDITEEQLAIEYAKQEERCAAIAYANQTLCKNVRRELTKRGLLIKDFADRFELSRGVMYRITGGYIPPRGKYRAAMLRFLGVDYA